MATDYWNQSIFTRKKHHGQIMTVQESERRRKGLKKILEKSRKVGLKSTE